MYNYALEVYNNEKFFENNPRNHVHCDYHNINISMPLSILIIGGI